MVDLSGCAPAEALAGSGIEGGSDGVELVMGPAGQVGAFREVLAEQAVGVLVTGPLSRRMAIAEVDVDAGVDLELDVLGQFTTLVPGQRPT